MSAGDWTKRTVEENGDVFEAFRKIGHPVVVISEDGGLFTVTVGGKRVVEKKGEFRFWMREIWKSLNEGTSAFDMPKAMKINKTKEVTQ